MKLYFKFLAVHLKCRMQYKASFFLSLVSSFLSSFTAFFAVYFLMNRFGRVDGFDFSEVMLCFSSMLMAFSLSECFFRGFDLFPSMILSGEFDRVLVQPRNEMLLVLCSKAEFSRIGRIAQAAVMLAWALPSSGIVWTMGKFILLFGMIASGFAVFSGLFVIYAAFSFFTIEGLEFMNILTYGGKEFGSYPFSIYGDGVLKFFTFVIPLALVQYYPLLYLTDRSENLFFAFLPALALIFLIPCGIFWRFGVRHYKSTGS